MQLRGGGSSGGGQGAISSSLLPVKRITLNYSKGLDAVVKHGCQKLDRKEKNWSKRTINTVILFKRKPPHSQISFVVGLKKTTITTGWYK